MKTPPRCSSTETWPIFPGVLSSRSTIFPTRPIPRFSASSRIRSDSSGRTLCFPEASPILNDWWGVRILNVADPSNPTEVAFYPTPQETAWLALSGNRLYVAEGSYGVEVIDVSDPAAPVQVGSFDTLGSARIAYNRRR